MVDSNNLNNMLDQLINDDPEKAQNSFHDYLKPKIQTVLHPNKDVNIDSTED